MGRLDGWYPGGTRYRAPYGADKYKFVKSRFLPGLCHPWHIPGQTRPEDSRALCGIFVFIITLNTNLQTNYFLKQHFY